MPKGGDPSAAALSAQIFGRGSVLERTQSSFARVQNRHYSRPQASLHDVHEVKGSHHRQTL